ncbi:hypothetical protein PAERUG_E6_London_17_VIM_2_12_12_00638 [Pseudomonas aeruginosa]|nr:hypothetical protein PAERUG_E6_London_17_VIM_2_12_12_00638 [Pseudomonas aeruginosa]CRQ23390.1 hypothetical protein PAERUG_E5_London_17_VIM_2_12_12_02321 [Pseudomonas aeruginosa]
MDRPQQQLLHVGAGHFVQRAERFVEQQHFRLPRQAAGQRGALGHAAGELRRVAGTGMFQADRGDRLVDAGLAGGRVEVRLAGEIEAEGDVLLQVQPGQQAGVLERHRDARMRSAQGLAEYPHAAGGRLLQAGQHAQQAGLADAAGTEDRDHLAGAQAQFEIAEHRLPAGTARIAEGDPASVEERLAHALASAWRCSSARSCTRLGVTIGTNADSRQRRAKPAPCSLR